MSDDNARRQLAQFLRSRRERIAPADVGLPAGPRRRAPGLRREEVAVLAGLSPTWYTYLEQGRDIHPSGAVLDSLARVLNMSEDERGYLHELTDGGAKAALLGGDPAAEDTVRRLVRTAEDSPYPVYGANLYCDMVAWNRAATTYYADFGRIPLERRNMMRWLLVAPEARQRLPEWGEDVRDIVARWRKATGPYSGNARLRAMVAEFTRLSPDFGRWWASHDVRELRSRVRHFRHPMHGDRTMRLIIVQAREFPSCIVVFHVPVDHD